MKIMIVNRREHIQIEARQVLHQIKCSCKLVRKIEKLPEQFSVFFFPVIKPAFNILVLFCISQFRASEKEKKLQCMRIILYITQVSTILDRPLQNCSFYSEILIYIESN